MVKQGGVALAALILSACATFPAESYCELSAIQVSELRNGAFDLLEQNELHPYNYEPLVFEERYIYRQAGQCWCLLQPRSGLDGELTIDYDLDTMQVSNLQDVVY